MTVTASASPSLALIKYWGKQPGGVNLPATSSLAVTLEGLRTTTRLRLQPEAAADEVVLAGRLQPTATFSPMIDLVRARAGSDARVRAESENSFPTAAGIASSSSGFAALALGLDALFETSLDRRELSSLARLGSGSASRAVYGGFTTWPRGAEHAEPAFPAGHWPELRVIVVVLRAAAKPVSSRSGMNRTSETSPVYPAWLDESETLFERGLAALEARDIEALGTAMRESYLLMFASMLAAKPPIVYWQPETVAVIHAAESMRAGGLPVWETMDAGPQVKLLTTQAHVSRVSERVLAIAPAAELIVAGPGGEPEVRGER
ncbi:MAG: diphosphomevalonate decarboxylase [Spirochaetota bacterium]